MRKAFFKTYLLCFVSRKLHQIEDIYLRQWDALNWPCNDVNKLHTTKDKRSLALILFWPRADFWRANNETLDLPTTKTMTRTTIIMRTIIFKLKITSEWKLPKSFSWLHFNKECYLDNVDIQWVTARSVQCMTKYTP